MNTIPALHASRTAAPTCSGCRRKLSKASITARHTLCATCQDQGRTLEPLPQTAIDGMRRVAFRKLQNRADVEEVIQDVHAEYMKGRVHPDLLLRVAKLRAIDRFRQRSSRERAVIVQMTGADVVAVRKKSGAIENDIVDTATHTPAESDDTIEAVTGLFVRGGRSPIAHGGRTIANPRRNEQRILGRLIVRQERERGRPADWEALDRWIGAGRGRTNRQDMNNALAALRQCGFQANTHRNRASNRAKTGLEKSRGNSPARSE